MNQPGMIIRSRYIDFIRLMVPVILIISLGSCDKFDGSQEIPAYLRIDSVSFTTDYSSQGTANHKLTDAWIYVNDQLIGGFEMPAEVPVLQEGICKVEVRAGIKLNGIADTRAPYPCLKPYIKENVRLSPDSVTRLIPVIGYLDNAEFVWREEFEDPSLAIKKGNDADTAIYQTEPENAPEALLDEYSRYSGIVYLDDDRPDMELVSDDGNGEGFVLTRGDFIFLELNFKTTVPVLVGCYVRRESIGGVENRPFIVLNTTDSWNKIYINFTPMVNEISDAINYKFYFIASKSPGEGDHRIMFDNFKLITRPNL